MGNHKVDTENAKAAMKSTARGYMSDRVVVGHLRMRLGAAMALCAAIDAAMALSA